MQTNAYIDANNGDDEREKKCMNENLFSVLKLTFLSKLLHTVILVKQIWLSWVNTFGKCNDDNDEILTKYFMRLVISQVPSFATNEWERKRKQTKSEVIEMRIPLNYKFARQNLSRAPPLP